MAVEEHSPDMNWADYFDSLANQHLKRRIEESLTYRRNDGEAPAAKNRIDDAAPDKIRDAH